jgi:DNA-directed RNA polymerase subunit RPC12/RpoP
LPLLTARPARFSVARRKKYVCPACGKKLPTAYFRAFPATNMRVRYFKCPCGRRLKGVEKLVMLEKK